VSGRIAEMAAERVETPDRVEVLEKWARKQMGERGMRRYDSHREGRGSKALI
jgi:hypothetical protein